MLKTVSVLTFVALSLAACGGGSGGSGSSPKTTTKSSKSSKNSSGSTAKAGTKFATVSVPGVGTVIVDARGRTVYVLTSSGQKNVPCTDSSGCTAAWPDLPLPDGTAAAEAGVGLRASLFGTTKEGGETYPTYNGYRVYEYAGDSGPGQANGQGIKSFGGTWYLLGASGKPVTAGA